MSGCVLNHWSVTPRRKFAERLASKIGWNNEGGEKSALEFLIQAPLDEMIMAQEDLLTPEELRDRISFPFGPTVEPYEGKNCFISKSPLELCRSAWSANMDVIISGTSDEGLMSYEGLLKNPMKLKSVGNFEYLVPKELGLARDSEQCIKFGLGLKQLYYPDLSDPSVENIRGFINVRISV
jgi:cholinesterase